MMYEMFTALSAMEWLLVLISFFASFLTVVAGIGGGLLLLAVMVTVFPPAVVIPVHGVVQLSSNGFRALIMRRFFNREIVLAFTCGSLLAALLGSQLVVSLDETVLQVILGLFILYMVWGPKLGQVNINRKVGLYLGGLVSTFASLFVGASGPVTAAFLGREQLGKEMQVATHAAVMVVQHGLKILIFGVLGFAFSDYALLLVLMIATGMAGTYAGRHVLFKLPEETFQAIFKLVITLLALRLLYSAFF